MGKPRSLKLHFALQYDSKEANHNTFNFLETEKDKKLLKIFIEKIMMQFKAFKEICSVKLDNLKSPE